LRAFALNEFGETGSIQDLPIPEPESGEVRIEVRAAGVNPSDVSIGMGAFKDFMEHRFPLIMGSDVSGVIEAIGPGVTEFQVGDEVFGVPGRPFMGAGSFADKTVATVGTVAAKLASLDHIQAAGFPIAGVTALQAVESAELKRGDVVLVVGAAGGVGGFAVQLASIEGAHVIGVARGANAEYIRGLGAAETIDYTKEDVVDAVKAAHSDPIAAIIDTVSDPETLARLSDVVRMGGHVVSVKGAATGEQLSMRDLTLENTAGMATTERLAKLAGLFDEGKLKPPEIKTFPFEKAADALQEIQTGHVRGKLVLTIE
jgi:NADPH:quinone reductase-like Zn-dependent oxidoreductase